MKKLNIPFTTHPVKINENISIKKPEKLVMKLALMKALAGAKNFSQGIAIGADTIVVNKGRIIGKPKNHTQAEKILKELSGTIHKVYTGVALVDCADTDRNLVDYEVSGTQMRKLSKGEIKLIAKKHLDKAGAYAVQEKNDLIIKKIYGDYFNVVGLPIRKVKSMLKKFTPHL